MANFITHPWDAARVGDILIAALQDPKWTEFRSAVAFVRKSGAQYIATHLYNFARRPGNTVNISVGADFGGSSYEGVKQLVDAISGFGKLWVYQNTSNTFHPKIFLFKNHTIADVIVGSGNLTKGGLFENSEAFVRHVLQLSDADDKALLVSIESALDRWSVFTPATCLPLDHAVLISLRDSGDLPNESVAKAATKSAVAAIHSSATTKSPFKSSPTPKAPAPPAPPPSGPLSAAAATATAASGSTSAAAVGTTTSAGPGTATTVATSAKGHTFGMTLQNTDVGVGQVSSNTQRRSPEVFLPLEAMDQLPTFWNWKSKFVPSASYKADAGWRASHAKWIAEESAKPARKPRPLDKLDWHNVKVRLAGHAGLVTATIWFNPIKKDIRIRQEQIRSAGAIGDILLVRRAVPGALYDFDMEVIPTSDGRYAGTLAKLTTQVTHSPKRIGYF